MNKNMSSVPVIRAEKLTKSFAINNKKVLHAVNEVDLEIRTGETLGLVGESGCGKSTLAKSMLRIIKPSSGKVYFKGQELTGMGKKEYAGIRRRMQMVFQDPYASLDPRMSVRDIIAEPLETYRVCGSKKETTERVIELMEKVGLRAEHLDGYPHQFSGGQRQRIGIARAIALDPELLVCDEPVSALDVSVQSQILNLLKKLREEMDLTSLFIGHDLSVIHFIADRICVMFLGTVCELADKKELFARPLHPYTTYLLDAIPNPDPHRRGEHKKLLHGEIPSPVNMPQGCCFSTRCPFADDRCKNERPILREICNGHYAACHKAGEVNS